MYTIYCIIKRRDLLHLFQTISQHQLDSAKERALSQVQRCVIDETLHPSEKLMDDNLTESLGVNRTPIREASQLLEV
jgi:DNA-binding GntR family transcriptional regulator